MIAVKSVQGRALYFETYYQIMVLALINYLLVHLFGKKILKKRRPIAFTELELWDCFSNDIQLLKKDY